MAWGSDGVAMNLLAVEWLPLPTFNAAMNVVATLCITAGWRAIRRKQVDRHRRCMLSAVAASTLFLAGYLTNRALHGTAYFPGSGIAQTIYRVILITHMILAVAIVPLVGVTLVRALRGDLVRHKKIARITLPIWLYVSVTGVVIWWMLFGGTFAPVSGDR